jgi:hypothetical protein
VFASLLPGFREVRTALAVGYIWLLAWWLAFVGRAPDEDDATGAWSSFYDVRSAASVVGLAIGVSFVAWIVGLLSMRLHLAYVRWTTRAIGRLAQVGGRRLHGFATGRRGQSQTGMADQLRGWWMEPSTERALLDFAGSALDRVVGGDADVEAAVAAVAPAATYASAAPGPDDDSPRGRAAFELARAIFAERRLIIGGCSVETILSTTRSTGSSAKQSSALTSSFRQSC